jgi:hypothetical protein
MRGANSETVRFWPGRVGRTEGNGVHERQFKTVAHQMDGVRKFDSYAIH